jgi:hypothetical protein
VHVSATGALPAEPEEAWARLTTWEAQADWMGDADEVRVLGSVREGVGVRIAVRTRVLNVPAFTEVLEVVRWEPPALVQIAHTGLLRGAGEWRLERAGTAVTRFTWTEDVRVPVPVLGEVALRIYAPFLRRTMRRSIAALAGELRERREPGAPSGR